MLHSLQRSTFIRPRERLHELLALQQIAVGLRDGNLTGHDRLTDQRTMAGQVQELIQRGLVLATDGTSGVAYSLSASGRSRLRMLTVDLARELETLQESTRAIVRAPLVSLALDGVRRVVLYPFGETAEMTYTVVIGLGMEVVGIVDDSPRKWGVRFHGLQVQPASALLSFAPDAVLVTSAVFQEAILARLAAMPLDGIRVHTI
jgi:hypothetical protein